MFLHGFDATGRELAAGAAQVGGKMALGFQRFRALPALVGVGKGHRVHPDGQADESAGHGCVLELQ